MGHLSSGYNIRMMRDAMDLRAQLRDEAAMNSDDQDRRIGKLKDELRTIMGMDAFKAFYIKTSMNGDLLEKQLRDKLESVLYSQSSTVS